MKDFLKKLFHIHVWVDDGQPFIAGGRYDTYIMQKCSECSARRLCLIENHQHSYSKWSREGSINFEERTCVTCGVTEIRKIER